MKYRLNETQIGNWNVLLTWMRNNDENYYYDHDEFEDDWTEVEKYDSYCAGTYAIAAEIIRPVEDTTHSHFDIYKDAFDDAFGKNTFDDIFSADSHFYNHFEDADIPEDLSDIAAALEEYLNDLSNFNDSPINEVDKDKSYITIFWEVGKNDTAMNFPDESSVKAFLALNPNRKPAKVIAVDFVPQTTYEKVHREIIL